MGRPTPARLVFALLICSLAASLLSGCSGGGGGGTVLRPTSSAQSVSITLDESRLSNAAKRNPKFVGSDADDLNYAFSPAFSGSTGDVSLVNCPNNICTITIGSVPIGTYTLTVTLKHGGASGTAVGQGISSPFTVLQGATNNVSIAIAPVLNGASAGPAISVPQSSVFYADGVTTGQTVVATVIENDPDGVAVCGDVPNWPTLTVSVPSISGLSVVPATISSPPPCSSSGSTVAITYNGNSNPAATSVAVQASDGEKGNAVATVSIPIVELGASSTDKGFTAASSSLTVSGSTSTSHAITITEANGFYAGETGFTASPSSCSGVATITPGTFNSGTASSPNSTQTFEITGLLVAGAGCTLTVASNTHKTLSTSVNVNVASSYTLFDDATLISSGGTTAVQASWSPTQPDGGVSYSIPAGLTVSNLTTLSTDYLFTAGTCSQGSPRFSITDGQYNSPHNHIFVYLGVQTPSTDTCAGSTYGNSGNVISASSQVDALQLGAGYPTWSAFQAAHGSDVVTEIDLVVDGYELPYITAQFKNTNVNGQIYGY
jgi:hypothetical protein